MINCVLQNVVLKFFKMFVASVKKFVCDDINLVFYVLHFTNAFKTHKLILII